MTFKKIFLATAVVTLLLTLFVITKNRYLITSIANYMPPDQKKTVQSISKLNLPEGFVITPYATNVKNARSMAMSENGILYVGTRQEGKVYAIIDENNDFVADKVVTLLSNLNQPNGVVWHNGDLYVAEIHKISVIKNVDEHIEDLGFETQTITADLPTDTHHGWRYLGLGPDNKLYISIGAPCNICENENPIYATINRLNLDGSEFETIAHGVRNSIGFDWRPENKDFYFTDNGRDWLGDDIPPDEFNKLESIGDDFGFPYCHGKNITDPDFGGSTDCSSKNYKIPIAELGPHVAALGTKFYRGQMFPEEYQNLAFIAEHGSWNRTEPIGYRITTVDPTKPDSNGDYKPFIDGWLEPNGRSWGRPVDILFIQDGSMLISDDLSGTIYRVTYYPKDTVEIEAVELE